MLHFSAMVKTPPRATKRRISRPDAGLAMIPTTFSRVEKIFAEPSLPDPLLSARGRKYDQSEQNI